MGAIKSAKEVDGSLSGWPLYGYTKALAGALIISRCTSKAA